MFTLGRNMAGARALLPIILVSVCLLVTLVIPNASAIEKPGSDPTRPSESIETEEDTIQVDELGGNQSGPAGVKPEIETLESIDKIKVTFDNLKWHYVLEFNSDCKRFGIDPCTDTGRDGAEMNLAAYVQGKKVKLFAGVVDYTNIALPIHTKEITLSIPKTAPLSIIIVGYEKDACPSYQFPSQIEDSVNEALSGPAFASTVIGYPKLKTIEYNLISHANDGCVPPQNPHEVFTGVNKVYEPLSGGIHYGEGTHVEFGLWFWPGYPSQKVYELKYTISYHPTYAPEIDDEK